MKSFQQFQEEIDKKIPPLPGLGGGGGGTNAITSKAKTKTFKNYVKDAIKIATFPISRRNIKPDPTEKFATEEIMANNVGGGNIAGTVEAGDDPPVNKKKKKGQPTIMARGRMPGARTRFRGGVELLAKFKKK